MQATIQDALVLEITHDVFEKKEDGITKEIPYSKLICYEFGQRFPKATIIKLPQALIDVAKSLPGKKCNILVNVFQKQNKIDLTFEGVI